MNGLIFTAKIVTATTPGQADAPNPIELFNTLELKADTLHKQDGTNTYRLKNFGPQVVTGQLTTEFAAKYQEAKKWYQTPQAQEQAKELTKQMQGNPNGYILVICQEQQTGQFVVVIQRNTGQGAQHATTEKKITNTENYLFLYYPEEDDANSNTKTGQNNTKYQEDNTNTAKKIQEGIAQYNQKQEKTKPTKPTIRKYTLKAGEYPLKILKADSTIQESPNSNLAFQLASELEHINNNKPFPIGTEIRITETLILGTNDTYIEISLKEPGKTQNTIITDKQGTIIGTQAPQEYHGQYKWKGDSTLTKIEKEQEKQIQREFQEFIEGIDPYAIITNFSVEKRRPLEVRTSIRGIGTEKIVHYKIIYKPEIDKRQIIWRSDRPKT